MHAGGDVAGAAAAQVLLVRPNETVVAFSRRAGAGDVVRAAEMLRVAIPAWSRAGDGCAFPKEGSAVRSDYWHPRPAWQVTASGLVAVPPEPPPVVDFSTAVVLTVAGSPDANEVVAELWSALHDGGREPAGAFAVRVAELWAWAAVDGLIDTLGLVAARWDADVRDAGWGVSREGMLGRVRGWLTDPYSIAWKRLGVRRVSTDEQDTLVLEPGAGMPLRVELVPAWFAEGGPPARAVHTAERTVVEVNVAATPEEVEAEVWACVGRGLVLPRVTPPYTTADLRVPMEAPLLRATSARLAGLAERYERAAAFAGDMAAATQKAEKGATQKAEKAGGEKAADESADDDRMDGGGRPDGG